MIILNRICKKATNYVENDSPSTELTERNNKVVEYKSCSRK